MEFIRAWLEPYCSLGVFLRAWPRLEVSPTNSPLSWCSVFALVGSFHSLSQAIWIVSNMVFHSICVCVFVGILFLFLNIMIHSSRAGTNGVSQNSNISV